MAKFFLNGKWKKRTVTALSLALSLTVSMGIFTACGGTQDGDDNTDDEETTVSETDTQLLKNGNFEFYSEKDKELDEKRALINTPTSWSFTSGSPTSDTASGIINTSEDEWDFMTAPKKPLVNFDTSKTEAENKTQEKANEAVAYAVEHWDEANAYDRLEFLKKYDDYFTSYKISTLDSSSDAAKLFAKYKYSVDFEDVEKLRSELSPVDGVFKTHYADGDEKAKDNPNLLMIHNSRTSDGVVGTAQYYTSSTTITLQAGTSAELSVWVKTSNLTHYYSSENTAVTSNAGAYIGVTHTVGGASLDQMQIKNINTRLVEKNNGWQQYSIYIRANTFAASTFKIVLGLGMGDTSNRYEQVNGYALFDDLTCKVITNAQYEENVTGDTVKCDLDSLKDAKIFDATKDPKTAYALDLHADFSALDLTDVDFALTSQDSGTKPQYSLVPDNSKDENTPADKRSLVGLYSYNALKGLAENNGYLVNIFEEDFKDGLFPFANESSLSKDNVILLLSTNGAAYTATVENETAFTLEPKSRKLVSFFVKTSEIRSGKTGASATLVDGENDYTISAFDSTTVAAVDIDDNTKDIYNGWVQCFFFVENNTKDEHTFTLKLNYGPTAVANSSESDYGDGYAAFANFETKDLSATQFGYATSGSYTQKVSLAGKNASAAKFDDAAATSDIKKELATPVNFYGVQSGSINVTEGGINNPTKEELRTSGLYTGLLNSEYADAYESGTGEWNDLLNKIYATSKENEEDEFWSTVFGDKSTHGKVATQPLVIMNTSGKELPAYGYFASTATVAASSYQKISMRVKVGGGAKAYIYLIDASDIKAGFDNTLAPSVPAVTYWYDDEGNICKKDPSSDDFKARDDIAYYLDENNGLYTEAGKTDGKYYANLANYKTAENGNLTTADGTVAFYYHDGKYYAYYDKTAKTYDIEVNALPKTGSIVRYTAPTAAELENYGSCIVVEGTAGKWQEVSFYIHTGSVEKSYRLEIWAGERNDYSVTKDDDGKTVVTPGNKKGIPEGGYVFFDNYSAESTSDYDTILKEYVAAKKDALNDGKELGKDGYLGEEDNLPKGSALYYTFTFYDSPNYLRYDVSKDDVDEDGDPLGNPYGSYKQSAYSEQLVWFSYSDGGEISGSPVTAQFLDYSAYDVDVPQDDLGSSAPETPTTPDADSDTNWLLILSSALLTFALLFAIGAIIVRRVLKNRRKNAPAKAPKQKKKEPKLKVIQPEPEPEADEPEDENNPYNE